MTISMDKRYETKCGYEVTISHIDAELFYPISGSFIDDKGTKCLASWTMTGQPSSGISDYRLILIDLDGEEPKAEISMDTQYETRDGKEVRFYTISDCDTDFPVHGAIKFEDGWVCTGWKRDGLFLATGYEHKLDLVEARKKVKLDTHIQIGKCDGEYMIYDKDNLHDDEVVALLPITIEFKEGDGL